MDIRIATYNIQFGTGQDGNYDLDRIMHNVEDADIICLQEVTTNWDACDGDDQPGRLADALNLFTAYSSAFDLDSSYRRDDDHVVNKRRTFGNMVLSRWPIVYSRAHSLGREPARIPADFIDPRVDLPRSALETVIDIPNWPVRVITVHLGHLPGQQRLQQIQTLRALLVALPRESSLWEETNPMIVPWTQGNTAPPVVEQTILAGDFNFKPNDPEYAAMLEPLEGQELVDGWLAACHGSSSHPATCIALDGSGITLDYVFFTSDISTSIVSAEVRDNAKGSDHFPLVFELAL